LTGKTRTLKIASAAEVQITRPYVPVAKLETELIARVPEKLINYNTPAGNRR
jgi:hypothetical protein